MNQYTILLLSNEPADIAALGQAFYTHPDHLTIKLANTKPESMDDVDMIITRNPVNEDHIPIYQLNEHPQRIGAIVDAIEAVLLRPEDPVTIANGPYELKSASNQMIIDGGSPIVLTETETNIVRLLIQAGVDGLSRDDLLRQVWNFRPDLDTHTLETHIYRLRQKIEPVATEPRYLLTMAFGYRLANL